MTLLSWACALTLAIFATQSRIAAADSSTFYSQLHRCPASCNTVGPDSRNWTMYHDVDYLSQCNHTVVFDFNIFTPPAYLGHTAIRACTSYSNDAPSDRRREERLRDLLNSTSAEVEIVTWGTPNSRRQSSILGTASKLRRQWRPSTTQSSSVLFALGDGILLGLYGGSEIVGDRTVESLTQLLFTQVQAEKVGDGLAIQLCGQGRDSGHSLGMVVSTKKDFALVQAAMQRWANSTCVVGSDHSTFANVTISERPSANHTLATRAGVSRGIFSRATCSFIQVVSGDSCGSLASKCKITGAQLTTFNPNPSLCSALTAGQYVCCSSGELPDFSPKPNSDGSCATYTVQPSDACGVIASKNFITTATIEANNKQTWGWQGCGNVQVGQIMCLSSGTPPMPAPISNAICGPQLPGTAKPNDWSQLSTLNPCPLNSCCNIWGQCGITPEFCTVSKSATGAPGTSAPGTAGCISNCGTDVTNNAQPPSSFLRIGYFEAWNIGRSCLTMDASQIPSGYTHIHFAFGGITSDFQVDLSSVQDQFNKFVGMSGFKRILSFGGWSFSTDQASFPIFRNGVTPANRLSFANSLIATLNKYNLDGVDFDWEYPSAPDIPGIPAGSPTDGPNYLAFLKTIRSMMPPGKTVSMAAPASYWYLKGFPIKEMEPILDYIVYMTYDLHGQWDYGRTFSNPGCVNGNCLRSHVNLTETNYTLAMVTKAGVPASKIMVGVSSYGRSFGMTDASCAGPSCLFNGPDSSAAKGMCTQQAGYIADAEISYMISQGGKSYHDDAVSDSDIVVYDGTWVAYMNENTKNSRISQYQARNFGGIVDWAIDLGSGTTTGANGTSVGGSPNDIGIIPIPGCTTLLPAATFTLTSACATAIANLPPSGRNNKPPGPSFCSEECGILQKITGTCCGYGGTVSNPIVIQADVPLPAPLPLAQGYNPSCPIMVPEATFPAGKPLPYPITIPKGSPIPAIIFPPITINPNQPLPAAVTIPAGVLPSTAFILDGITYAAGSPLSSTITFPAGFRTSSPIAFPSFTVPAGTAPSTIVLPMGYYPNSPISVPATTYPGQVPLPQPIQVPRGASFPTPLAIPQGAPLVVPPPGATLGSIPSPTPIAFPLEMTECWNLPSSLTYTALPDSVTPSPAKGTPVSPTPALPYSCQPTVTVSALNCQKDCCGWIPCPSWCNAMCGGVVC